MEGGKLVDRWDLYSMPNAASLTMQTAQTDSSLHVTHRAALCGGRKLGLQQGKRSKNFLFDAPHVRKCHRAASNELVLPGSGSMAKDL